MDAFEVFGNFPMDFWVCFCYLFVSLINGISWMEDVAIKHDVIFSMKFLS